MTADAWLAEVLKTTDLPTLGARILSSPPGTYTDEQIAAVAEAEKNAVIAERREKDKDFE